MSQAIEIYKKLCKKYNIERQPKIEKMMQK